MPRFLRLVCRSLCAPGIHANIDMNTDLRRLAKMCQSVAVDLAGSAAFFVPPGIVFAGPPRIVPAWRGLVQKARPCPKDI